MKRIFLLILMFSIVGAVYAKDDLPNEGTKTTNSSDNEDLKGSNSKDAEENITEDEQNNPDKSVDGYSLIQDNWKNDSRKIADMIAEVRTYRYNRNDSTLQAQRRNKQKVQASERMNHKFCGTHISLETVRIEDVKPEKETGHYVINYVIPKPESFDKYSSYDDGIYIPDDNSISVKIIRIEKSEDKAAALNKGELIPLEGKIKSIIYEDYDFCTAEKVVIELE